VFETGPSAREARRCHPSNRRLSREIDLLLGNSTRRGAPRSGTRQPTLLAGMLFDGDGNRMTPTHAVKKRRVTAIMFPVR
jgi:hypothetical protein